MNQRAFRHGEARIVLGENFAEALHGGEELRSIESLVADHQHQVLDERLVDDVVDALPNLLDGVAKLDELLAAMLMLDEVSQNCSKSTSSIKAAASMNAACRQSSVTSPSSSRSRLPNQRALSSDTSPIITGGATRSCCRCC